MTRLFRAFLALSLLIASPLAAQMSFSAPGQSGAGTGTVTSVGVTTANGVSGTVTNPTTTPAISVTLGAITPSSVSASGTVTGSNLSGTHSGASSGTNTGDQTITLTSDVTGTGTGSFATTIANGAVSLPKMASLAANSILGNNTGVGATPIALTTAQTKGLLAIASSDVSGLAPIATSGSATDLSTGTLPAGRMVALTGDVTNTAGTVGTTIGANVVTYAKFQQVAASSLVGNPTGSLANAQAITLAGGLTFSGTTLTAAGALTPTSVASTGAISGTTVAASSSILSSGATNGIGYSTGAGGTATQGTSRVTGVTINKACGAITIFSAAGASTYNTFTVTDSAVAATDTIIINQKSGTNLYIILITAVGAGTFNVSFATTGGTATDAPVFNYCAIKGVAA